MDWQDAAIIAGGILGLELVLNIGRSAAGLFPSREEHRDVQALLITMQTDVREMRSMIERNGERISRIEERLRIIQTVEPD